MCVSGAATSTTHHCLQGGNVQRRERLGEEIQQPGMAVRQHWTGNMALISAWEGCLLWEWILHGHTMGLPALEAEVFYFYFEQMSLKLLLEKRA